MIDLIAKHSGWLICGLILLGIWVSADSLATSGIIDCSNFTPQSEESAECERLDEAENLIIAQPTEQTRASDTPQQTEIELIPDEVEYTPQTAEITSTMKITVIVVRYAGYESNDWSVRARATDSDSIDENPSSWSKAFANCPAEAGATNTEIRFRMSELASHPNCSITFTSDSGETYTITLSDNYYRGYSRVYNKN